MKRVSPISKKCEKTLDDFVKAFPSEQMAEVNNLLVNAVFSDLSKKHDFPVLAAITNYVHASFSLLKSVSDVLNEIDKTGSVDVRRLLDVIHSAGYEFEEDGRTLKKTTVGV